MRQRATGDPNGMRERERVWVACVGTCAERRLVYQRAQGKVREEKAPRFLAHQVGRLAAQHALRPPQMRLERIERGLDVPSFVIQGG